MRIMKKLSIALAGIALALVTAVPAMAQTPQTVKLSVIPMIAEQQVAQVCQEYSTKWEHIAQVNAILFQWKSPMFGSMATDTKLIAYAQCSYIEHRLLLNQ